MTPKQREILAFFDAEMARGVDWYEARLAAYKRFGRWAHMTINAFRRNLVPNADSAGVGRYYLDHRSG
jgi:hypothetical protein